MWFTDIANVSNPGRNELDGFVTGVEKFLKFVIESKDFGFLWKDDPELQELAQRTMQADIQDGVALLKKAIPDEIPESRLLQHGLIGRPLQFKFRVLDSIGRQWEAVQALGKLSIRDWVKRLFDAIDAILDSLIDAAGGAGGLIKEFKDALAALVKTI